jgi:hypothetical protein
VTADDMVENGREAAILALYRRMSPRRHRAMLRALERRVYDGVPWAECLLDAEIECGTPPAEAREMVRQALASPADRDRWRRALI